MSRYTVRFNLLSFEDSTVGGSVCARLKSMHKGFTLVEDGIHVPARHPNAERQVYEGVDMNGCLRDA